MTTLTADTLSLEGFLLLKDDKDQIAAELKSLELGEDELQAVAGGVVFLPACP